MSLRTYGGHTQLVYDTVWSPSSPSMFASVAGTFTIPSIFLNFLLIKDLSYNFMYLGDGMLHIWAEEVTSAPTLSVQAHKAEVLSCDWCKYDNNVIATGASDGLIRVWDIRRLTAPISELQVWISAS